jgi:mannose-6-phosphate isomerase-like protein (cupin superfamily)
LNREKEPNMRRPLRFTSTLHLSVCAALLLTACGRNAEPDKTDVLPPVRADANPSAYQPRNALLPIADGVVGRTVAQAESGRGYRIEVREFTVGPGPRRVTVGLQAAGVLEVSSGSGTLDAGAQPQTLQPGSAVAIPAQPQIAIENTTATPLVFRAYLFIPE